MGLLKEFKELVFNIVEEKNYTGFKKLLFIAISPFIFVAGAVIGIIKGIISFL